MAEINPLAFIGRSNDPSLTKRTTDASASSDALQRGLAQISLQGQNADRLAGINNESLENRGLASLGLTNRGQGAANLADGLNRISTDASKLSGAQTFSNLGSGVKEFAGGGYQVAPEFNADGDILPQTLGDVSSLDKVLQRITPTSVSASAAGVPVPKVKNEAGTVITKQVNTDAETGKPLSPIIPTKTVTTDSTTTEQKGGAKATKLANAMLNKLILQLPNNKISFTIDPKTNGPKEDDDYIYVTISGVGEKRIKKKGN